MAKKRDLTFHPSFLAATKQLQFTFAVDEYLRLIASYTATNRVLFPDWEPDRYWARLPKYTIARCPLCSASYVSVADTHGIFHWGTNIEHGGKSYSYDLREQRCPHLVNVQAFLNFNGNFPTEYRYIENRSGDTPIILSELFETDPTTCAVIHTLPICRVEEGRFVPRYSVYFVTYYAEDGETAYYRRLQTCHGAFFHSAGHQHSDPQIADLPYWVKQGKLFWLDLADPRLPLCMNRIDAFPYANIQGYGKGFVYTHHPKPAWPLQFFWNPNGHFAFELPL